MSEKTLTRVVTASKDRASLTFADGLCGSLTWAEILREAHGIIAAVCRLESARPSADGTLLEIDHFWRENERAPQGPDKTASVPVARLYDLLLASENFSMRFDVEGRFGPQTLAFVFLGREKSSRCSEQEARALEKWEVQEWYTSRGFPRGGNLTAVDRRGRAKATWQML